MSLKAGYKVVREVNGEYLSSIQRGDSAYTYCPGKARCRRKGWGPMGVFDTFADAEDFGKKHNGSLVTKCMYLPSEERYFYCLGSEEQKVYSRFLNPTGTRFADEVCLEGGQEGGKLHRINRVGKRGL